MKQFISLMIILLFSSLGHPQTFDDYFRIAVKNNPGLQARFKDFEAALARIPQVGPLADPTLSVGLFISPAETRSGPQRIRFSLTQMFPWFGTRKAQRHAAALLAEARYQAFLDARNKLRCQVADTYYPLVEISEIIRIENENIETLELYKSSVASRYANGKSPLVDAIRVEIKLNDAVTGLGILEERKKALAAAFNKVLNREARRAVIIAEPGAVEVRAVRVTKESIFTDHPVLKKLSVMEKYARASEKAARKQGLPGFGVGLDYVIVGERPDLALPGNGKDVIMPMVTVSIPVFRKKYHAAVKEARLQQRRYALEKQNAANMLEADLAWATFEVNQQRKLLFLYEKQIEAGLQSLRLLLTAYENSGRDFEEVLRMQQQLFTYKKLAATARKNYYVNRARIDYITAKSNCNENR